MRKSKEPMIDRRDMLRTYLGAFVITFLLSSFMALCTRDWAAYGLVLMVVVVMASLDFTIWICSKFK